MMEKYRISKNLNEFILLKKTNRFVNVETDTRLGYCICWLCPEGRDEETSASVQGYGEFLSLVNLEPMWQ
jgi:hypothetical protein